MFFNRALCTDILLLSTSLPPALFGDNDDDDDDDGDGDGDADDDSGNDEKKNTIIREIHCRNLPVGYSQD